jgi:hypothetical protein
MHLGTAEYNRIRRNPERKVPMCRDRLAPGRGVFHQHRWPKDVVDPENSNRQGVCNFGSRTQTRQQDVHRLVDPVLPSPVVPYSSICSSKQEIVGGTTRSSPIRDTYSAVDLEFLPNES